ncbi:SDR family NAD(P)-dependent oxidoreductase [Sphingomonas immobilis]|uniref:SDR family oxidoreductase n=1 Tax=Sphingomonas immobilis TaxID=3063997 RepID=A0ABT9A1D5_9SPHN|nr:SDR family oxidoreductase [Sphingomonas sp. CA1-15]MDO7843625.1 SDR family oxidoreductase [Sphingomonas sp. CA1-15]
MSLFDLTGKVAVITGATKGIGRGIAEQMTAHGARVVVSSRNAEDCSAFAAELDTRYGKDGAPVAKGATCDLDDLADIQRFAEDAIEAFGSVDILVCNAAVLPFIGPSVQTPPDTFTQILNTNIHHNFRLVQALRPAIAAQGGGSIVLVGSIAGHAPSPNLMAYAAAKAGVSHMARCLADELVGEKIRVNCVAPGFIRSFSSAPVVADEQAMVHIVGSVPLKRIGEPEDIAGAAIFLSSRAGSYVTGATILVDGGRLQLSPPSPAGHDPTSALRASAERLNKN